MERLVLVTIKVLSAITVIYCVLTAQQFELSSVKLEVVDAKLGKDVINRIIIDEDSTFEVNSKVFLWLKVIGGASDVITITWESGKLTHSTELTIEGSPWRTWASKTLFKAGDWGVTVTDANGNILKELSFKVR